MSAIEAIARFPMAAADVAEHRHLVRLAAWSLVALRASVRATQEGGGRGD